MKMPRLAWWKILSIILVVYAITAGLLLKVPAIPILHETIRNLYYHVTMWFGMMILMTVSVVNSVKYLRGNQLKHDVLSREYALTGIVMGIAGIATGSLWAKYTWGAYWVNDPKLNGAAITLLIYLAYMVLRSSVDEQQKRARLAAVYNIFAFVLLIVFLMILPRTTDSLHPGNGGNPGFSAYESDLDSSMRLVFYPAIAGWTLLGVWLTSIRVRLQNVQDKLDI
jgi:heme exporter protein C